MYVEDMSIGYPIGQGELAALQLVGWHIYTMR